MNPSVIETSEHSNFALNAKESSSIHGIVPTNFLNKSPTKYSIETLKYTHPQSLRLERMLSYFSPQININLRKICKVLIMLNNSTLYKI